jgi:O-antigen/teichoic acid export membrane protein
MIASITVITSTIATIATIATITLLIYYKIWSSDYGIIFGLWVGLWWLALAFIRKKLLLILLDWWDCVKADFLLCLNILIASHLWL